MPAAPKPKSPSPKAQVIGSLFSKRYDSKTASVANPVVTLNDVSIEINALNGIHGKQLLSAKNPANFMKDIVRRHNRNAFVPASIVGAGWTVQQLTGKGQCFRFVPLPPGQTTAFPTLSPAPGLPVVPLQSLSLVPAARRYGRNDESWLTQVASDLSVVQSHFAFNNIHNLAGIAFVASNIKLGDGEADGLYYAEDPIGNNFLLACEMKGITETLDEDQILRVAEAVKKAPGTTNANASVIPVGVKVAEPALVGNAKGLIWVREYSTVFPPLTLQSEGLYRLEPAVPGIG